MKHQRIVVIYLSKLYKEIKNCASLKIALNGIFFHSHRNTHNQIEKDFNPSPNRGFIQPGMSLIKEYWRSSHIFTRRADI